MSTSRPEKLSEAEIAAALSKLPEWKLQGGKLRREYKFADFVAAFGFMTGAALVAQAMDHHPEWFNVWNVVRVDLATHDAGGVTALDVELAHAMEELAGRQLAGAVAVKGP
jgi:4a-hydroxytetrahydrobiopterin dehydratase